MRRGRLWLAAALGIALALAPMTAAQAEDGIPTGFSRVWAWLTALLLWETEAGPDPCASFDPSGRCLERAAEASSDQCSHIDPDGRCLD